MLHSPIDWCLSVYMQCCLNACCLLQLGDYRKDIRDLFFALFYGRVLNYYDAKQQQFWSSIFYYSLFFQVFSSSNIVEGITWHLFFHLFLLEFRSRKKTLKLRSETPLVQYLTGLRDIISSFFLSFLFRSCSVFFSLSGTRRNFDCMSLITSCRSDSEGNCRWHTGQQGSLSSVSWLMNWVYTAVAPASMAIPGQVQKEKIY